jgi:hypothetical protein
MRWDQSRPVPWRRLTTEWVVVTLALVVIMTAFLDTEPSALASLLVGGVVYLAVGYVLAKLGYQRATVQSIRDRQAAQAAQRSATDTTPRRPRPAPTKRTGGGGSRPPRSRR